MPKAPALVLSSGGLHSLVTAGLAGREHRVALLHVQDGRITAKQAAAAFAKQVTHFKPLKAWSLDAPFFRQMSLPPETTSLVHVTGSDQHAGLIPTRDLQFLTLAAGYAKQIHASTIFWGVQFEQKQTEALARNIEIVQIVNGLLEVLFPESPVVVKTPLMGLDDHQVIELGYQIGVPFSASWTCQMAVDSPCMGCSACARRTRSFRGAQLADPLVTKSK
jgi:7-cyano-7-deazaguanine synthase in queuosine biosynthesis